MKQLHVSLVLATVERTKQLEHFLISILSQTYHNFELIVVDQNLDNRLVPILTPYQDHFPILHLRSKPGLSHARNVGLRHVKGDIIGFPDDDCCYPPDLLERVVMFFQKQPQWDGLSGRSVDSEGHTSMGRFDHTSGQVNLLNVWRRSISTSIFLRFHPVMVTGEFDEQLGAGSGTPWGSAEETDYLIRCLTTGFQIYYDPEIIVIHPYSTLNYTTSTFRRGYSYGMGAGRVLRKHHYPLWFFGYWLLRPLGGVLVSCAQFRLYKALYHWKVFKGRLEGWLSI